jgi:hypothetical protein
VAAPVTATAARVAASASETPRPPAAVAAVPVATAALAAAPVERQARCIEILQKASLEKITPTETDFFKRECK